MIIQNPRYKHFPLNTMKDDKINYRCLFAIYADVTKNVIFHSEDDDANAKWPAQSE